jgi:hypothetical protein
VDRFLFVNCEEEEEEEEEDHFSNLELGLF